MKFCAQFVNFLESLEFSFCLFLGNLAYGLDLFALVSVYLGNRFFSVVGLLLENFDLSVFHADTLEELVEIDVAHELHLFCNIFQLGESFYFGLLELL